MNVVLLFDYISEAINQLNVVRISPDQFKILVHFILSFPLAMCLRTIKSPIIRQTYITLAGLFFMLYLGAQWVWLVLLEACLIYALSFLKRPFIPICVTSFAVLGYLHYDRFMNLEATWKMGFNVVQMMLTCRLVYFGAAVEDKAVEYNFMDFFSYLFYFPNIIVGTVPFIAYADFVNLRGAYAKLDYSFRESLRTLGQAALFVAASEADQLFRPKFDFNWFDSQEWIALGLFERHIVVQLISMCARFKYFLAFKFSQAAMEASGITLGQNFQLADYRFEIEFNCLKRTKYWNSSVQLWLQTCFYDRFRGNKFILAITFAISAFWHGFYLAYYMFFIEWALFNDITKQFYKSKEKFKMIPKKLQYIICVIYGQLAVNSTSVPVGLLQWNRVIKAMHELGWVAQIMILCLYVFLKFFGMQPSKSKK